MQNKKAQQILGLSFSVIFSLLLIIFFIIIAFIAIKAFLNTKNCAQMGMFVDDLGDEVKRAWDSQKNSFWFESQLPSKIELICFANLSKVAKGKYKFVEESIGVYKSRGHNLFFYPPEKSCQMPSHLIEHLDMEKITAEQNPYCIENDGDLIRLRIEKGFNERYVTVS